MTPPPDDIDEEERELLLLEAQLLVERSSLEFDEGQYDAALELAQQALELFEQHGHLGSELPALIRIAEVFRIQGRRPEALAEFERCLRTAQAIGDKTWIGNCLQKIGTIHTFDHHYDRALPPLLESLAIAVETGNRLSEGQRHRGIASVHYNQGRFSEALTHFNQALIIARETGVVRSVCENLGSIGSIHRVHGDLDQAMSCFREAADIADASGIPLVKSRYLSKLASAFQTMGNHEEALELKLQALEIARETGNRLHQGHHLSNIGNSYALVGQNEKAEASFRESILICDELDTACAGFTRCHLAMHLSKTKRLDEALELLRDGEPQVAPIPYFYGVFLCRKSKLLHLAGETDGARAALEQARDLTEKMGLTDNGDLATLLAELTELLG